MIKTTTFREWLVYYFASVRRGAAARKYQYKTNVQNIADLKFLRSEKRMTEVTGKDAISVQINRNVSKLPLSQIQQLLIRDLNTENLAAFSLQRKDAKATTNDSKVEKWSIIASLFNNPIEKNYSLPNDQSSVSNENENTPNQELLFKYTIKLDLNNVKENGLNFDRVIWPDLIYSYSCRGIGVTPEIYKQLDPKTDSFINPATNSKLLIYEVDFVPEDYDAVGLFPQYIPVHKTVFKEMDRYTALIHSKPCLGSNMIKMRNTITSKYHDPNEINTFDSEIINISTETATYTSKIRNLEDLIRISKEDSKLWATKDMENKTCPGDILRPTILSNDITLYKVREEYIKNYIIFNITSLLSRINQKEEKLDLYKSNLKTSSIDWKPWDLFIWEQYKKINEIPTPKGLVDLISVKDQFDEFLKNLFQYQCLVVSEMKSSTNHFFSTGQKDTMARSLPISSILSNILQHCKWFEVFYPGLHEYIKYNFKNVTELSTKIIPLDTQTKKLKIGEKINNIVREILGYEHELYSDKFVTYSTMNSIPIYPIEDWKILILSKIPLPMEYITAIRFNSKIFTQFVKSLEVVDKIAYSTCVSKKMIDDDTYIFLYKLNREKKTLEKNTLSDLMKTLKNQ